MLDYDEAVRLIEDFATDLDEVPDSGAQAIARSLHLWVEATGR